MGQSPNPRDARYSVDFSLSSVRSIATGVDPESPELVSQRKFDPERASAGIECPRASDISRRLNTPWPELLELVFDETSNEFQQVSTRMRGKGDRFPVDHDTCVAALRLAASRVGKTTLRPFEYAAERERAIGSSRGTTRQTLELRWPPESQIEGIGWNRVLSEAGLELPPPPPRTHGISNAEALDLFLQCRGYLPHLTDLFIFARSHGIGLKDTSERLEVSMRELRARRKARGEKTPRKPLSQNKAPLMSSEEIERESRLTTPFRLKHPVQRKNYWSEERIMLGLDFAVKEVGAGKSLTQKELRKLAKEYPTQIPSANTVTRFGERTGKTLKVLREEAIARTANP